MFDNLWFDVKMFLLLIIVCCALAQGGFDFDSAEMRKLIEVGKSQYQNVNHKSSLPVYGSCWKNAVFNLHVGCKNLNEVVQSNIALRFTDCFLSMSGHEPYNCEATDSLKNECLTSMSDRGFMAYTEFYTHTQNICFYLQSQIWREETEKSIYKLTKTSSLVTEQLEQAEEIQMALLEHQKETMSVQKELLDTGESLNGILLNSQHSLHEIMSEFRMSTMEQKKMLFDVFERLASLQAWAVGEISWLDSVVFYVTSAVICYIITATPRTQAARIWIFVSISTNALVERTICTYLLNDNYSEINEFNENLYWWIWVCRKVLLGVCSMILVICIFSYRDYNVVNHELLLQIQKQNQELMNHVKSMDISLPDPLTKLTGDYSLTKGNLLELHESKCFMTSTPISKDEICSKLAGDSVDTIDCRSSSLTLSQSSTASLSSEKRIAKRARTPRRPIIEISTTTSRYMLRSRDKSLNSECIVLD